MVLVRRLLGDILRRQRQRQGRTLREVSALAQVSLGYLSEVERGQKEASSELLAAICAALDIPLSEILREMSDDLEFHENQLVGADQRPKVEVSAQRIDPVHVDARQVDSMPVETMPVETMPVETMPVDSMQVDRVEEPDLVEDIDTTVARLADVVAA